MKILMRQPIWFLAMFIVTLICATAAVAETPPAPTAASPAVTTAPPSASEPSAAPVTAPADVNASSAASSAASEELAAMIASQKVMIDTVWVLFTGFLVFWMNAGFALVESGFCRAKNTVNILSKNFIVFAVSTLSFFVIGWGLMFGNGSDFAGTEGLLMLSGADNSPATGDAYSGAYSAIAWTGIPLSAKFFFQLVFAGTAATIVSGCVAERIKYLSFIVFAGILVAFAYPISGHWIWGGGWLAKAGFWDFAGSTAVHTVGAVAGLAGIIVLGPRLGKYRADGTVNPIFGHNMSSATLGCLILWLGWFGFNPGSTMAADPTAISHIANTTNLAAAAGLLSATAVAWLWLGKPDLGMTINGCLAGFVAITAPCAWVSPTSAIIIGLIGGVIVVPAVIFFDKIRIDDPVGALAVHLVNGVFGTLAVGLFSAAPYTNGVTGPKPGLFFGGGIEQLIIQAKGSLAVIVFTFVVAMIVWLLIKFTIGLRVTREEEIRGLDIDEHGMEAYPDFESFMTK